MINLGDEAKCNVTGFYGIVTQITECLNGCRRITIQPPVDKDMKHPDAWIFDETQVTALTKEKVKPVGNKKVGPPPERAKL